MTDYNSSSVSFYDLTFYQYRTIHSGDLEVGFTKHLDRPTDRGVPLFLAPPPQFFSSGYNYVGESFDEEDHSFHS